MMSAMSTRNCLAILAACLLSACTLTRPAPSGTAQPSPGTPAPASEAAPAAPEKPYTPPARQFRLGAASTALLSQAHAQAAGGDFGQAAATLERALRIEPENPLLWIELGRVRLGENNPQQADSMGRKALSLATGDPSAQASAWKLIGDSLRVRGRNGEAAEADRHAQGLATH